MDLDLIRTEDRLKFSIYRKATSKDRYIMANSFHHTSHKAAAFHSMIYRAISIALEPEELEEEKSRIYKIAAVNGCDLAFVDKTFHRHQRAQNRRNNTALEPLDSTKRRIYLLFYPAILNQLKRSLSTFRSL